MTTPPPQAAPSSPTRRALREAEYRRPQSRRARLTTAAAAAITDLATAPQSPATPAGPGSDRDRVQRRAARRPARNQPVAPRSRRTAPQPRRPLARRWLPRAAILTLLAAATTGIPLSGAALPTADSGEVTSSTFAATSALDVLAAEPLDGTDAFDGPDTFAVDPLAQARTHLAAGRTTDREVLQCGSASLQANGQVAASALTEPVEVMQPLPTGSYRITSAYGARWGSKHEGLDMAAPAGTPIRAVADGEVTYVGYGLGGRSGMIVVLKHEMNGEVFWTWYIHMYPNGIFVGVGDQVTAGDVIAEVGSYGNSTGPHLHLEVQIDDQFTTVDPQSWLTDNDAAPITEENLACAAHK